MPKKQYTEEEERQLRAKLRTAGIRAGTGEIIRKCRLIDAAFLDPANNDAFTQMFVSNPSEFMRSHLETLSAYAQLPQQLRVEYGIASFDDMTNYADMRPEVGNLHKFRRQLCENGACSSGDDR